MIPLSLLVTHFIGDFLLQSDWMALNKNKKLSALVSHVSVYSLCFLPWGWKFVLVTFVLHYWVDYYTSRVTSKLWFMKPTINVYQRGVGTELVSYQTYEVISEYRHWFFVAIGFDQLIHYFTLAATLKVFGG